MENKEQDNFDGRANVVEIGCTLCDCLGKSAVVIKKCKCICHGVFEVETDVDGNFKIDYNERTIEEIKNEKEND